MTRLGLSKEDLRQLRAHGIRTLEDLTGARSQKAALRELPARSVAMLQRALRARDKPPPAPVLRAGGLPKEVADAVARAKRASARWKGARRAHTRGPARGLERMRETPRLRAMLAMADAAIKAYRAQEAWATAERVRDDLDAYALAVEELLGPER